MKSRMILLALCLTVSATASCTSMTKTDQKEIEFYKNPYDQGGVCVSRDDAKKLYYQMAE